MVRTYSIVVNGQQLVNGVGKLQVNGNTDVRRCIVNGIDVINNTGELTFTLSVSGVYNAWSDYHSSCGASTNDSFHRLTTDSLSLSLVSSDFKLSGGSIAITAEGDTLMPYEHFNSLPYSLTNWEGDEINRGAASYGWSYIINASLTFDVEYIPTGETFTIFTSVEIDRGEVGDGTVNWDEFKKFSSTQTQTLMQSVKEY